MPSALSSTTNTFTLNTRTEHGIDRDDDEHLMEAYACGNNEAFTQLYSKHELAVYRYLFNGCKDESSASELFQDIWLRVVKARASYDPAVPFRAWLFTIARNRLTDHYRQQSRKQTTELSSLSEHPIDQDIWRGAALTPEQIAAISQDNNTLRNALHCLPEAQREAVMLKHIAGMDLTEIAHVQGEGTQTVKSRLRYAMVKLRQNLKGPS